jgi:hypothetical protein
VRVTGLEPGPDSLDLAAGQLIGTGAQRVADPIQLPKSELIEGTVELIEHVVIEGIAEIAKDVFKRAALGLAGVVITVLQLPGDTRPCSRWRTTSASSKRGRTGRPRHPPLPASLPR